jgi:YfiH family protein
MLKPILADNLAGMKGVAHGFFTRQGGVSEGIYASLNCGLGSGDAPETVRENRRRVIAHLGATDIVSAHQVHGTTALHVDAVWPAGVRPKADAMVTATHGLALGVLTADCAPILMADAQAGVVGAAHAGWRGAIAGVLEATIEAMERLGASRSRIMAAVGPCIRQPAYEVGPEFEAAFLVKDPASVRFFSHGTDPGSRAHFDLSAYALSRLEAAGVARAVHSEASTYAQPADFISYRGSKARQEPDYGRQISAIVLT